MRKLQSPDDLIGFRKRIGDEKKLKIETPTLVVCAGTGGQARDRKSVV